MKNLWGGLAKAKLLKQWNILKELEAEREEEEDEDEIEESVILF